MGLVRRITVLKSSGETVEAVTVHQEPRKRPRVSAWTSPIERAARRLVRAQVVFGQEVLRRHNRSNRIRAWPVHRYARRSYRVRPQGLQ